MRHSTIRRSVRLALAAALAGSALVAQKGEFTAPVIGSIQVKATGQ